MAEQLMSTKGASHRGLRSWMAQATSSLPVPVAPVMRTELSFGAMRSITEMSFLITNDWPISVGRTLVSSRRASLFDRFVICRTGEPLVAESYAEVGDTGGIIISILVTAR